MLPGEVSGFHPAFEGEAAAEANVEIGTSRDSDVGVGSIEIEGLSNFSRCEAHTALKHTVVIIGTVVGIAFARPPTYESRRRGSAVRLGRKGKWQCGQSSKEKPNRPLTALSSCTKASLKRRFKTVHSHPPDFEKKVLGWRFGPATRQG